MKKAASILMEAAFFVTNNNPYVLRVIFPMYKYDCVTRQDI